MTGATMMRTNTVNAAIRTYITHGCFCKDIEITFPPSEEASEEERATRESYDMDVIGWEQAENIAIQGGSVCNCQVDDDLVQIMYMGMVKLDQEAGRDTFKPPLSDQYIAILSCRNFIDCSFAAFSWILKEL